MGKLLSADLGGLADEAERTASQTIEQMGLEAKGLFNDSARTAAGGDSVLSGVGKKGRKISARYDFQKGSKGLTLTVKAIGPWQFVETGHKGGYQVPRRPKRRGKLRHMQPGAPHSSTKGSAPNTGWATAPMTVRRAARAQHAWSRTADAFLDDVQAAFDRAVTKLVTGR